MLLRHVTLGEIMDAIQEIMGDDCSWEIETSSPPKINYNGGYYVRINNHPERVLLYYADTFYDKLNDYCVKVEEQT